MDSECSLTRTRLRQLLELGSLTAKSQMVNTISDVIKTYYDIVQAEAATKKY